MPDRKNDNTVKLGERELMLCFRCDNERHWMWLASWSTSTSAANSSPSTSMIGSNNITDGGDKADDHGAVSMQAAGDKATRPAFLTTSKFTITTSWSMNLVNVNGSAAVAVNELLSYVQFYRDKASTELLHKVTVNFLWHLIYRQLSKCL